MEKQKVWTANNFRFRIDGFETPCARVSKIDSFTIKQNISEYHGGGMRAPIKVPSVVEFPNLVFYVPEIDAQPFYDHFKRRGVDGEVPSTRLTGMLQCFDNSEQKQDLFTLEFEGADIFNVQPDKLDAGSEEIKQVKVELYTESMTFKYH